MRENEPKDLKGMGQRGRYDSEDKVVYLLTTSTSVNARDRFYKEFGILL